MLRFFLLLSLMSGIMVAGVLLGADQGYFIKPTFFIRTLVFLIFSTAIIFVYLYRADKPHFFLQLYLLTMVLKLLAYCTYNLVMILKDKPGAVGNVVFFMVTYFFFTMLEIAFLHHRISGKSRLK